MSGPGAAWPDASLAAALIAVAPADLGGAVLRARSGPVRAAWVEMLDALLPADLPRRRVPPEVADDRLLGGLDLAATLKAGRPAWRTGLLAEADGGIVTLPMGERVAEGLAGRLAAVIDRGGIVAERDGRGERTPTRFGLIVLDEGAAPDEATPETLSDRLAFRLDLTDVAWSAVEPSPFAPEDVAGARARLPHVRAPEEAVRALTAGAAGFAIPSLRAPLLAIAAARASAALRGVAAPEDTDLAVAARLVLAPRARAVPPADAEEEERTEPEPEEADPETPEEGEAEPPPPPPGEEGAEERDAGPNAPPEDVVLEAARAAIPADLLERLAARERLRGARADTAGASQKAATRGRPAGTRQARPGAGQRLDLVGTLRTAAPWQPVRRRTAPHREGVIVSTDDLRARRFIRPAESVLVFVVDASGSAAAGRLAEAKGAVERMLARAYERREKVALIAFRGTEARLLLPPTRSLTRAKRELAGLPGGGGTPLAAGLRAALQIAETVRRGGATPYLALLTDGRGNIALDGTAARAQAAEDTMTAARRLRAAGIASVMIDTSTRPRPQGAELAAELGARYLAMPKADAARIGDAVRAGLGA